ncbi:MAG: metabolite traffic protein EboE [Opitutia bacterium]
MRLSNGLTLAYCTNVHRGEGWDETFAGLRDHALRVRERVCPGRHFTLGLRLGAGAAAELARPEALTAFRRWLELNDCSVSGINGFPYGAFHGRAVKDDVFAPDWCEPERLEYTVRLFDLLAALRPPGAVGTVSTLPGSFKGFARTEDQQRVMRRNVLACAEHLARLRDRTGAHFRLALEPEPIGLAEDTPETVRLFARLRDEEPARGLVDAHLGTLYDTCHFALQYEEADRAIPALAAGGAPAVKFHLSSALSLRPTERSLARLAKLHEPTYLHQTLGRRADGSVVRFKDVPLALAQADALRACEELRVHFHVPVNADRLDDDLGTTNAHLRDALDVVCRDAGPVRELEIETYTWEVLPPEVRSEDVADMVAAEYRWTLAQLARRGVIPA